MSSAPTNRRRRRKYANPLSPRGGRGYFAPALGVDIKGAFYQGGEHIPGPVVESLKDMEGSTPHPYVGLTRTLHNDQTQAVQDFVGQPSPPKDVQPPRFGQPETPAYADPQEAPRARGFTHEERTTSPSTVAEGRDSLPEGLQPYVSDEDVLRLSPTHADELVRIFNHLPPSLEVAAGAHLGRAKRGWYRSAARALNRLFGPQAPQFAALLAATSPQKAVEANLRNAGAIWLAFHEQSPDAHLTPPEVLAVLQQPSFRQRVKDLGGYTVGNEFNNVARALTFSGGFPPELISGPKIDSFWRNLLDESQAVTNDVWNAHGLGVEQTLFSGRERTAAEGGPDAIGPIGTRSPGYMAVSAKFRKAAHLLNAAQGPGGQTWTPAEIQETFWSAVRGLAALGGLPRRALRRGQPGAPSPEQINDPIQALDNTTHEWIANNTDFLSLLLNDQRTTDNLAAIVPGFRRSLGRLRKAVGREADRTPPLTGGAVAGVEDLGPHARTAAEALARRAGRYAGGFMSATAKYSRRDTPLRYAAEDNEDEGRVDWMELRDRTADENRTTARREIGPPKKPQKTQWEQAQAKEQEEGLLQPPRQAQHGPPPINQMDPRDFRRLMVPEGIPDEPDPFMVRRAVADQQYNGDMWEDAGEGNWNNRAVRGQQVWDALLTGKYDAHAPHLRLMAEEAEGGSLRSLALLYDALLDEGLDEAADLMRQRFEHVYVATQGYGPDSPAARYNQGRNQIHGQPSPEFDPGADSGGPRYQDEGHVQRAAFMEAVRRSNLSQREAPPRPQYRRAGRPVRYADKDGKSPGPSGPEPEGADSSLDGSMTAHTGNVEEGLDFGSALKRAQSGNHKAFKEITDRVTAQLGLKGQSHVAVGDWEDGAEESILGVIKDPTDLDTLRYVAAWYGLLGNQRAVMVFSPHPQGLDSTYTIQVPETNLGKVRQQLSTHGVPFRTLVPGRNGTRVVIYDEKRQLRDQVAQFAGSYGASVRETTGQGEFIGGGSRTAARAKYRNLIAAYEATGRPAYQHAPAPTDQVHQGAAGVPGGDGSAPPEQPSRVRQSSRGTPVRYALEQRLGHVGHSGPVKVYRNINLSAKLGRPIFSIMDLNTKKVIGHSESLALDNARFMVNEKGRQRVLKEKVKNVHAFVVGHLADMPEDTSNLGDQVTYNPYKYSSFVVRDGERPVQNAGRVHFHDGQVYAQDHDANPAPESGPVQMSRRVRLGRWLPPRYPLQHNQNQSPFSRFPVSRHEQIDDREDWFGRNSRPLPLIPNESGQLQPVSLGEYDRRGPDQEYPTGDPDAGRDGWTFEASPEDLRDHLDQSSHTPADVALNTARTDPNISPEIRALIRAVYMGDRSALHALRDAAQEGELPPYLDEDHLDNWAWRLDEAEAAVWNTARTHLGYAGGEYAPVNIGTGVDQYLNEANYSQVPNLDSLSPQERENLPNWQRARLEMLAGDPGTPAPFSPEEQAQRDRETAHLPAAYQAPQRDYGDLPEDDPMHAHNLPQRRPSRAPEQVPARGSALTVPSRARARSYEGEEQEGPPHPGYRPDVRRVAQDQAAQRLGIHSSLSERDPRRQARPGRPRRLANAPAGGVVVRGLYYPGGRFIPGTQSHTGPKGMKWDKYASLMKKVRRPDGSYGE